MWVEDVNGDLVNLAHAVTIESTEFVVYAILTKKERETAVIFNGANKAECQAYMTELKKELAAFGKLIKIELP